MVDANTTKDAHITKMLNHQDTHVKVIERLAGRLSFDAGGTLADAKKNARVLSAFTKSYAGSVSGKGNTSSQRK